MLFVGQDIVWQRPPTPGQHGNHALAPKGTDQAIDRHRGEMADDRTALSTEAAVGGQQRITGHLRAHLSVAQDEVRQDCEHGFAGGALHAPEGEPAQANPRVMGVAREAPTLTAAGLVEELKVKGEEEGEDEFDQRCGVAQEGKVGYLIEEVDGDRAVVAYRFSGVSQVSFPVQRSLAQRRHGEGHALKDHAYGERLGAPPLNSVECAIDSNGPCL